MFKFILGTGGANCIRRHACKAHHPATLPILRSLDAAADLQPNVYVFGADYLALERQSIRVWLNVIELAKVHLLALARALGRGAATTPCTVGNGGSPRCCS